LCEQNAPSLPPCGFFSAVSKISPHTAVMKARSHHIPCDIPCRKKKRHTVASPEARACFPVDQKTHCNATQNAVTVWPGWLLQGTTCVIHIFFHLQTEWGIT